MRQDSTKSHSSNCFAHNSQDMSSRIPDSHSNQSAEEVLALNAAAIIANIKLQRQLSKKKTPHVNSEKDSSAPAQGNAGTTNIFPPYVITISHFIKTLISITINQKCSQLRDFSSVRHI